MKHGKREMPRNKKGLTALVALVLIFCCAVGGTLAWLTTKTDPVTNTFTPAHVTTAIYENGEEKNGAGFIGEAKTDVKVKNTGNTDAYIRAAIIFNWADASGNVYGKAVTADDYTIVINKTDWTKGADGFYYYNSSVEPGVLTSNLIESCTPQDEKAPEGYALQVTILADGIQAKGITGATNAQTAFANAKTN